MRTVRQLLPESKISSMSRCTSSSTVLPQQLLWHKHYFVLLVRCTVSLQRFCKACQWELLQPASSDQVGHGISQNHRITTRNPACTASMNERFMLFTCQLDVAIWWNHKLRMCRPVSNAAGDSLHHHQITLLSHSIKWRLTWVE
jgi:hypothetical protein